MYTYSPRFLEHIAEEYINRYSDITYLWEVSDKIDFDLALSAIGKGHWPGNLDGNIKLRQFWSFGRMQQVVIADLLEIKDWELDQLGFYNIDWLRRSAYRKMADWLNGKR